VCGEYTKRPSEASPADFGAPPLPAVWMAYPFNPPSAQTAVTTPSVVTVCPVYSDSAPVPWMSAIARGSPGSGGGSVSPSSSPGSAFGVGASAVHEPSTSWIDSPRGAVAPVGVASWPRTDSGRDDEFVAVTPAPPATPPTWSKSISAPSASTTNAEDPYEPSAREPESTEFVSGTSTARAPESPTAAPSASVVTCASDCGLPP